jgi:protein TonB
MFERSLVISQQNHALTPQHWIAQRWTALVSITIQAGLAALLIALPLLHPERLLFRVDAPKILTPNLKMPKVKPVTVERVLAGAISATTALALPATLTVTPGTIPHGISKDEGPPAQAFTGMGNSGGIADLLASNIGSSTKVTIATVRSSGLPLRVSNGVSAGMLMAPIRPIYPAIARAAKVDGTVIVEAVISKSGLIESLHVVSGPEMLRVSAMDAIRAARYQPYRLNGEPTEVLTTITVNFRIGS